MYMCTDGRTCSKFRKNKDPTRKFSLEAEYVSIMEEHILNNHCKEINCKEVNWIIRNEYYTQINKPSSSITEGIS